MSKDSIGRKINILARLTKNNMDHNLQKHNITMEQSRFLLFLHKNLGKEIYQKDICDYFYSSKGSVSTLLDKLEKSNLIERFIGSDARHRQIKITNKGIELVKHIKIELDLFDEQLLSNLDNDEKEQLFSIMRKMFESIR